MISAPASSTSRCRMALTAPWGVSNSPRRAWPSLDLTVKRNADTLLFCRRGRRAEVHAAKADGSWANVTRKLRVGIIYGGRSGEHEVSVVSAASIFKHL